MRVSDEYAWLRDPAVGAPLMDHLRSEQDEYRRRTAHLSAARESAFRVAASYLPEAQAGPWWEVAGDCYWFEHRPGAEYPVLCRRAAGGIASDVLDLDSIRGDSPYARLGLCEVSPDGRFLAYALDTVGDESYTLKILDVDSGEHVGGGADRVYYGGGWVSGGFVYVSHDDSFRPWQVSLLPLPDSGDGPAVLLTEEDPRFHITTRSTDTHLIISANSRLTSQEWALATDEPRPTPVSLGARREGVVYAATPVERDGRTVLLVATNDGAEDFRLVLADGLDAEPSTWRELLPEQPGRRLHDARVIGDRVAVACRRAGALRLLVFPWDRPSELAEIGPAFEHGRLADVRFGPSDGGTIAVESESYLDPACVEQVDPVTLERRVVWQAPTRGYARSRYASCQIEVEARDGVHVPVTLVHHADTPLDGTAPCLLYGYGAWETVIEPSFDPSLIHLLDQGVVFAHAHIRGGGELGRRWWLQGRMDRKMTTFTDFADVAGHLAGAVVDGARIVCRGRSAGGLLMGAAYSLWPTLWRGVVAEVPFVDPVTTMSDPDAPLVIVERDEWGDPRREADESWMLAWSPFDNPPPVADRPPVLATSAVHDSRVSVWEPARWLQRLRDTGSDRDATLFRVELGAGAHAVPPGRYQGLRYMAEIYSWVAEQLGVE